ncbi:MAG: DUF3137 domain-containing protein [Alphaproteobacteria bacterium]|nr:DUF3137 domain-containing protein [Alphaproteobacteria bacterium]
MYQPQNPKLLDLQMRFREFYEQNLKASFAKLEEKRLNYNHTFWARLFVWTALDIAFLYDLINHCKTAFVPAVIISVILFRFIDIKFKQEIGIGEFICGALMILLHLTVIPKDIFAVPEWHGKIISAIVAVYILLHSHILAPVVNFNDDTKNKVQQKIISFFGNFKYKKEQTLPAVTLKESHLFNGFHTQTGDDYFSGEYQGVGITVSEETLITGHGKNKHNVFSGIIIELEMNKNFNGQTVVFAKSFFRLPRSTPNMSQVVLEDSVFNKKFKVYATDQVEARFLLTTVFMENVIKLKEMYHGKTVELSFFDNNVLIVIPTSKNMFETTSLFRSALDYRMMSDVVKQFHYIFEIIEVLQLNKKVLQ